MKDPDPAPTASFVEQLGNGETAAWREFLRRYGGLIQYLGRRLRLRPEEREDLFQATCLQVLRKVTHLRNPERLGSWVYTVAWNEGRQILRKRKPEESHPAGAPAGEEDPGTDVPGIDEVLAASRDVEALRSALGEIDERCRSLLEALYFRDPRPPYREVSEEFGIAVGSIGPIRARCLDRLARRFRDVSQAQGPSSASGEREKDAP